MAASRRVTSLVDFCRSLIGDDLTSSECELFAKVLSHNDDSGRHGVLVPSEAYEFFPPFEIRDPAQNATISFSCFDCISEEAKYVNYKYYQRYPERRITRLNSVFNDRDSGFRLAVFVQVSGGDGSQQYFADLLRERVDAEFWDVFRLFFSGTPITEGLFSVIPVGVTAFEVDRDLGVLLEKFDEVSRQGWIDSLRSGDTGIGYTFESLIGIEENNNRIADFRGIEIKCGQVRETGRGGKINLFQQGPVWTESMSAIERLRSIGALDDTGRLSCYSQVTTVPNNLELMLYRKALEQQIEILKSGLPLGYWTDTILSHRLQEKHSRAVFIKAEMRSNAGRQQYHYCGLVYCERPSIDRFIQMVEERKIVFEFMMRENGGGRVRNHGYPWRLISEQHLHELFSLRIQLREDRRLLRAR